MSQIAQTVKRVALNTFAEVQAQGDCNVLDINLFTRKVQSNIIVSQLVGSEYLKPKLSYRDLSTGEESRLDVGQHLGRMIDDIMVRLTGNPLLAVNSEYFAEKEIFAVDKHFIHNVRVMREFLRQVVTDKKKLADPDASDMVSLLLKEEVSYSDAEQIVDDLIVLFIAGQATVQNTTTNLIAMICHNPEELKRMRACVDPFMAEVQDNIMEKMTMDAVDELEYVKLAYMEAMRMEAPVSITMTSCMNKDTKVCGIDMREGDAFWVGIQYAHNDLEQWKQPALFKPDRFDSTSEWFKRPDGGKRSPFAYTPFLGGTRVCLGKTFAEVTLRLTIPLWYHCFDFELAEPEQQKKRPFVQVGATKSTVIPVRMTTRNKVADLSNFQLD